VPCLGLNFQCLGIDILVSASRLNVSASSRSRALKALFSASPRLQLLMPRSRTWTSWFWPSNECLGLASILRKKASCTSGFISSGNHMKTWLLLLLHYESLSEDCFSVTSCIICCIVCCYCWYSCCCVSCCFCGLRIFAKKATICRWILHSRLQLHPSFVVLVM